MSAWLRTIGVLVIIAGVVGGLALVVYGAVSDFGVVGDCNSGCQEHAAAARADGHRLSRNGAFGGVVAIALGIALRRAGRRTTNPST